MGRPLKVAMLGLRGFPDVQGGVEKHVEHLARELVALGCEVEALVRAPYMRHVKDDAVDGVRLVRVWSPTSRSLEAIVHSVLGLFVAAVRRPDVLHIHAVGPALVTPLARALGLRVVFTHHGPDYDREKWGGFARLALRLGEQLAVVFANERIAISRTIAQIISTNHGREAAIIPNGVRPASPEWEPEHLRAFGLEPGRYVVTVGRLVPEKRHLDLIAAFEAAALPGWKLAIVGQADHDCQDAQAVVAGAAGAKHVVLTGFQTGAALHALYEGAGLFALPSSHEGLPIALLEALSYGLPAVASDIAANLEVELPADSYFPLGDVAALAAALRRKAATPPTGEARAAERAWIAERYDWRGIAERTAEVYRKAASPPVPSPA